MRSRGLTTAPEALSTEYIEIGIIADFFKFQVILALLGILAVEHLGRWDIVCFGVYHLTFLTAPYLVSYLKFLDILCG